MKIAITGLANCGKTTVFNAVTALNAPISNYPSSMEEPLIGSVKVPDTRIETLSGIYKPKKTIYSTIEYMDYSGLKKGEQTHNKKVYDYIKHADTIVEVIRVFNDDAVVHPESSINPLRDALNLETELILFDMELVEKRLERMEEAAKRGKKPDEAEKKVLLKCKETLDMEKPLRGVLFSEEELKSLRHLQFISIKPKIVVLNIAENDLGTDKHKALMTEITNNIHLSAEAIIALCGKIEMEIAQLTPTEAAEFLKELRITEPAYNKLIQLSYKVLGLMSFLTVGEDEVRAWTVDSGATALEAAGKIHSDIQRGFIRAEVIAYDDFIRSGSMTVAKQHGLLRLEGKTYIVSDGDIINFRFNV
ncbi:MAG: redox-regulated ATPase YchF [Candidatus Magnetoovum sp. WYHC-5]|nr:redox-regulated ATPase YchF [Candidatus Magnetoovum sp. WYHC-5]